MDPNPRKTEWKRTFSTNNSRIFSQIQVQSSFLGAESSYLAKSVYIYTMMHDERDLHYPAWSYVGMRENPSLSGRIPPKSGWLDSLGITKSCKILTVVCQMCTMETLRMVGGLSLESNLQALVFQQGIAC